MTVREMTQRLSTTPANIPGRLDGYKPAGQLWAQEAGLSPSDDPGRLVSQDSMQGFLRVLSTPVQLDYLLERPLGVQSVIAISFVGFLVLALWVIAVSGVLAFRRISTKAAPNGATP